MNTNQQWEGECFVFDSRLAVKQNLEPITDKNLWKQVGKKMWKEKEGQSESETIHGNESSNTNDHK